MPRLAAAVLAVLASACTFTGLGGYTIPVCKNVLGSTNGSNEVGVVTGTPQVSYTPGVGPVAAFVTGGVVQIADEGGTVGMGAPLFTSDFSPVQPFAIPVGTGYAAVAVATTLPCTLGAVTLGTYADSALGTPTALPVDTAACPVGAALPAIAALSDQTDGWVAWYATPADNRSDSIEKCEGATAAPLHLALGSKITTESPVLAASIVLTSGSVSVRPPAMTLAGSDVLLASPDGNAVSLWDLAGTTLNPLPAPLTLSGLAGARAVSVATDSGSNIAVVAEIGCRPQSIALALGTLSGGFNAVTTVSPASASGLQVQPTVAWVADQGYWNVSWLSNSGGDTHVLAQRFDTHGVAVGEVLDPHASLLAATLASDGTLFGYQDPTSGSASFENVGLGCALGPGGNESAQEP